MVRVLDQQKLQQEEREAQERIRIEREKAYAEIAKLNAEETAKREYTANERMKAFAAMRSVFASMRTADAAINGAFAPVMINQNVNQNVTRPSYYYRSSSPVWYPRRTYPP